MRKQIIGLSTLSVTFCLMGACAGKKPLASPDQVESPSSPVSLVGVWEGTSINGKPGRYTFCSDGSARIDFGGKDALPDGRYILDISADPWHLDLFWKDESGEESGPIPMIAAIVDGKLSLGVGEYSDQRLTSFEEAGAQVIELTKQPSAPTCTE